MLDSQFAESVRAVCGKCTTPTKQGEGWKAVLTGKDLHLAYTKAPDYIQGIEAVAQLTWHSRDAEVANLKANITDWQKIYNRAEAGMQALPKENPSEFQKGYWQGQMNLAKDTLFRLAP